MKAVRLSGCASHARKGQAAGELPSRCLPIVQ
jgi:hypothetical protein